MKIRFIEGDITLGKVNGLKMELPFRTVANTGRYTYDDKMITIVKQKYWYILLFVLAHEFTHWIIDCIFPYKKNGFNFNLKNDFTYDFSRKVHFLHNILDRYWKIPQSWRGEK